MTYYNKLADGGFNFSFIDPAMDQQFLQAAQSRQDRFDKSNAMLQEQLTRLGELETYDPDQLQSRVGQLQENVSSMVQDKYQGDYGAAANEIVRQLSSERRNPFYGLNKEKVRQGRLFQAAQMKDPQNFIGINDPLSVDISKEGVTMDQLRPEYTSRTNDPKYVKERFSAAGAAVIDKIKNNSALPGYFEQVQNKGLSALKQEDWDAILSDSAVDDYMRESSYMQDPKIFDEAKTKEGAKEHLKDVMTGVFASQQQSKFISDQLGNAKAKSTVKGQNTFYRALGSSESTPFDFKTRSELNSTMAQLKDTDPQLYEYYKGQRDNLRKTLFNTEGGAGHKLTYDRFNKLNETDEVLSSIPGLGDKILEDLKSDVSFFGGTNKLLDVSQKNKADYVRSIAQAKGIDTSKLTDAELVGGSQAGYQRTGTDVSKYGLGDAEIKIYNNIENSVKSIQKMLPKLEKADKAFDALIDDGVTITSDVYKFADLSTADKDLLNRGVRTINIDEYDLKGLGEDDEFDPDYDDNPNRLIKLSGVDKKVSVDDLEFVGIDSGSGRDGVLRIVVKPKGANRELKLVPKGIIQNDLMQNILSRMGNTGADLYKRHAVGLHNREVRKRRKSNKK